MTFGVSAPKPNANQQALFGSYLNGPSTTLPASMQPNLPQAITGDQAISEATGYESMLPAFMQLTENNPTISQDSPSNYANAYFTQNIAPQLGTDAGAQWLGGNAGTAGQSTFGANYLADQDVTGLNQAQLAGQQYYTSDINNLLNERSSFFGNDVALATQQNQAAIQQAIASNELTQSGLGQLNQYRLGAANDLGSWMEGQQSLNLSAQEANAANTSRLIGGLTGGLFGLGSLALGGGGSGGLLGGGNSGGGGGGGGGNISLPSFNGGGSFMSSVLPSLNTTPTQSGAFSVPQWAY